MNLKCQTPNYGVEVKNIKVIFEVKIYLNFINNFHCYQNARVQN
jgi:hypothetical protein